MSIRENFIVPKRYNTVAFVLMAIGLLAIIALYIATHGGKHDDHDNARFWGSLLQNSVYFLLITNAAMFFFLRSYTCMGWMAHVVSPCY